MVSVIIATRNRSALLRATLDAVAKQTWPTTSIEVIVADNGSSDDTAEVVHNACRSGLPVRYLSVQQLGKSHAVNQALNVASGEIIALTDDDVRPSPDWVERLADAIAVHDCHFVAGRILPQWETPPPSWLSPRLYGVLAIADNGGALQIIAQGLNTRIMPIGANMAVKRDVFARLGGLRTDLGKLDGTLRTGEDHEFFLRLLHSGCWGVYEPLATVQHFVPAARLTRAYVCRWLLQNGGDVAKLEWAYSDDVVRLLGVPRYLWRMTIGACATCLRAVLTGNSAVAFSSITQVLWFGGYARAIWSGAAKSVESYECIDHNRSSLRTLV
jgi:glycosyltransferase involved in cell wall biosynthesis